MYQATNTDFMPDALSVATLPISLETGTTVYWLYTWWL